MNRNLIYNGLLAALAAGVGALAGPEGLEILPESWMSIPAVALVWGALRVGFGVLAAGLGKPIVVDEPSPSQEEYVA